MRLEGMRSLARFIVVGVLALAAVVATQVRTNAAALSDVLARKIIEAQKAEADRLFERALANYGEAMGISKSTPDGVRLILKKRAALFEQLHMPERAEADLSQAIETEPFDPRTLSDRGYFYIRQNRISEALDDFVRGAREKPADAEFLYGAARALVAKGDFKNAAKFYAEAIERAPADGKLYLGRAEAEVRLGQYDLAMADYNQAFSLGIANRDDRFFAFTGRGYISLMNADFGVAVDSFTRALELSPGAPNVLLWRGYAYERQGRRDLALRDFQDALAASPDSEEARSNLARLRTQIAETGGAKR